MSHTVGAISGAEAALHHLLLVRVFYGLVRVCLSFHCWACSYKRFCRRHLYLRILCTSDRFCRRSPFNQPLCIVSVDNPCDTNPCLNGASCRVELDSYTCSCAPGYDGRNCSIGKQWVLPCQSHFVSV